MFAHPNGHGLVPVPVLHAPHGRDVHARPQSLLSMSIPVNRTRCWPDLNMVACRAGLTRVAGRTAIVVVTLQCFCAILRARKTVRFDIYQQHSFFALACSAVWIFPCNFTDSSEFFCFHFGRLWFRCYSHKHVDSNFLTFSLHIFQSFMVGCVCVCYCCCRLLKLSRFRCASPFIGLAVCMVDLSCCCCWCCCCCFFISRFWFFFCFVLCKLAM